MASESLRKYGEAVDAIANGRPDDAEELTLEWVAAHSSDPIARQLVNDLFESRERE